MRHKSKTREKLVASPCDHGSQPTARNSRPSASPQRLSLEALVVTSILLSSFGITSASSLPDTSPNAAILTSIANAVAGGSIAPQAPNSNGINSTQQQHSNGNQFVIKFIHSDSKNNISYVNIVPVNYVNLHEPRIDLRYNARQPWVSVDERVPNNTVVAAVLVNDPDSGPSGETSLSIDHGNELNHFKLVSTGNSNTIQVNQSPLSRIRQPEYNLLIVARDHGSPPKSSNITLVIKVTSNNPLPPSPMDRMISADSQQYPKPPVTDLMYMGAMLVVIFSALIFLFIIGCALVQRPKSKKGPPPPRTTSATNSRIIHPMDQCFCPNI